MGLQPATWFSFLRPAAGSPVDVHRLSQSEGKKDLFPADSTAD